MSLCHGMCYHTPGDDFVNKICCHISWKFVWIRINGGQQLRIVIITKVFVRNENIHHSLILLACGYLLICDMQQFSHYKKIVSMSHFL